MATTSTKRKASAKTKNDDGVKTPKAAPKKKAAVAKPPRALTLVTGGTGFLGAHLVRQLVEAGERDLRVMATSIPAWLAELGIETFEGSVTERDDVARAVEGVTQIYHLAGRVSRTKERAHEMYALHVEGTRLVCEAAQAAGVKTMVLASTSGTVAVTEDGDTIPDEEWPTPLEIVSRWPYYASKVYQERVALENFSGANRRLVIMNPSLLLGPGDDRLSSTKVILDFLARKIISVPKGGLSFVDVRDAAESFRAAMERGRHGERYLLGAANWTFADFFGRLERQTKTPAPRFSIPSKLVVPGARMFHALYEHWKLAPPIEPDEIGMAEHFWYLDPAKAERELGFTPRDTAETLHDTVSYVRTHFLGNKAFA
ncbi:MAG: NAD-dependent epimerase/dehydratase family protein [Pyrinomonadaceae bacterium]|nr:NAD-dependent epimerase/dehydratase family protein [Pyrinomonadaceae bacterium]